jgi:hypothetical protein
LLKLASMIPQPGRWCRLIPAVVAELPETAGVFEVANLVRNVVYIGRAEGRLRERLTTVAQTQDRLPSNCVGGFYFRYDLAQNEESVLATLLSSYQSKHGDRLPPGNREGAMPARPLIRRVAA